MDYDEYIATYDSVSDDDDYDDDPTIEQLKYNAFFAEEDGWIIVLPGFKPHRYNIKPPPDPPAPPKPKYNYNNYGMGNESLAMHDRIISSMREMALKQTAVEEPKYKEAVRKPSAKPDCIISPIREMTLKKIAEIGPKYNNDMVYESMAMHDHIISSIRGMTSKKNEKNHNLTGKDSAAARECHNHRKVVQRRANNPSKLVKPKQPSAKKRSANDDHNHNDNLLNGNWDSYCCVANTTSILERFENVATTTSSNGNREN